MKQIAMLAGISVLALSLAACGDMNKQTVGVISGGAIGGLLGSQFGGGSGKIVAAVGGAVLGAFIGGAIGKNMDETDKLKAQQALEDSRTNQTTRWSNPDNGARYQMTPTKTYYRKGHPCRSYKMLATIDGKAKTVHGTACRENGKWVNK